MTPFDEVLLRRVCDELDDAVIRVGTRRRWDQEHARWVVSAALLADAAESLRSIRAAVEPTIANGVEPARPGGDARDRLRDAVIRAYEVGYREAGALDSGPGADRLPTEKVRSLVSRALNAALEMVERELRTGGDVTGAEHGEAVW